MEKNDFPLEQIKEILMLKIWRILFVILLITYGCKINESNNNNENNGDNGNEVNSNISAVWANEGGDKVTRDELRASQDSESVKNSVWDGTNMKIFGAKNEVVAFNLVLEAASKDVKSVTLTFNELTGPSGSKISSSSASGDGVFDWTNRNIEIFYIRYLKIKGLGRLAYESYDERHIPERFRRPWTGNGEGSGTWNDRLDHNKFYPDIAVPIEMVQTFDISVGQNQSIWVDIYIPKTLASGIYQGNIIIQEEGVQTLKIPVELKVLDFTLPDVPTAKTMVYLGDEDIITRYLGKSNKGSHYKDNENYQTIRDRHFMMAHRHRISLIDAGDGNNQPPKAWIPRLNGSLFTASNGYDGPGVNVGNNVYSIGTYSSWSWYGEGENAMRQHTNAWANWFSTNSPNTEYFLYLIDESDDYDQIEQWARWINNNPGSGSELMSLATIDMTSARNHTPSLDIPTSIPGVGLTRQWQTAFDHFRNNKNKRAFFYNGIRPGSGTNAIEDDGVALRQLAWGQYKKGIDRWFFWESTYYNNFQGDMGQTNVFQNAHTFGSFEGKDNIFGETGWNYSNGDGVFFYPGTDLVYPQESYGLKGPIVSLRLKYWRRGIQDVEYLTLAVAINPGRVTQIVKKLIPKILWEYGVTDPSDPTWVLTDISWPTDPDRWETARSELASIIEGN